MGYEEDCKAFHKERKEVAHSAWKKLEIKDYNLTEREHKLAVEALQYYLQKT